jgi:hypothetical protein
VGDDEVSGLALVVGGDEGESGAGDKGTPGFVEVGTEGEAIDGRTIARDVGENGEHGTGRFYRSVELEREFGGPGRVSESTIGKDEVALRETLEDPTLDVLAALVGVPVVPRRVGDAALDDVSLEETEVLDVDEGERAILASFGKGLRTSLDEIAGVRFDQRDRVRLDGDDLCESPVVGLDISRRGSLDVEDGSSASGSPVVDGQVVVLIDRGSASRVYRRRRGRRRRTGRDRSRRHDEKRCVELCREIV